jgi:DNA-binding HxlR family transcriptional regulator
MLVLRDIGVYKKERFNRLLESIPGITPRVLATHLKELEAAGLIKIVEKRDSTMLVRRALTEKGIDATPILMVIVAFGSKYEAEKVFVDKKPRKLGELFNREAMDLLQRFI